MLSKKKKTRFLIEKPKVVSFISLLIIIALIFFNTSYLNIFNPQRKNLSDFNKTSQSFYKEYKKLQEERVRLASLGYKESSQKDLLNQMNKMHKQAEKTYQQMIALYNISKKINVEPDSTSQTFLAKPVYAGALTDFTKNVIWNLPVVSRLAHGFDSTTDHLRLGLYKGYFNAKDSGLPEAPIEYLDIFKSRGLEKPEDILTAPAEVVTAIQQRMLGHEVGDYSEVDLAKAAVKSGIGGVKAYFDGILVVTGAKSIDVKGEVLNQLGIPPDLQEFVKIKLGSSTAGEYIADKAKEKLLELYEYILTPAEIDAIMNEDTEEIKKIILRAKGEKIEPEDNKDESNIKTILALSDEALNMSKQIAEQNNIDKDTLYHNWPKEIQRELALKLNEEEEKQPLLISGKTESGSITPYLIPSGMWQVLTSSQGNIPTFIRNVKKEQGRTSSLINLVTRLKNAKKAAGILEQESATFEQIEDEGLLEGVELESDNKQGSYKKDTGMQKILNPLIEFIKNPPWKNFGQKSACEPNWKCTDWAPCIKGDIQMRNCTDVNGCGYKVDKDMLFRPCLENNQQDNYEQEEKDVQCIPDWQCSAWSACTNSLQNRDCQDKNNCNTNQSKPEISQACQDSSSNSSNSGGTGEAKRDCSSSYGLLKAICEGHRPTQSR